MRVNSKFKLFMQTDLSSSDFKVLAFLYQPLIGVEAYAIYITFYHLIKQNDLLSHKTILDILNLKQADFIKYREKLEAVGLFETYEKDNEYVYILKAPYTAKQFLTETFLGTYLESEIGEKNLEYLMKIFKLNKPIIEDHNNITKSFDDLYMFNATKLLNVDYDLEGKNGNNQKLIRKSIDYEAFIERLPRALKSSDLMNENFKQKLMQLAAIYQFSVSDMVEIYQNAHKGKKNVAIAQINLQAKKFYESSNQDLVVIEKSGDEEDVLNNLSFKSIIDKFSDNNPTQKSMALSTINDFINQNEIDNGVLNVLLIFVLKNKNGILPHVNYLNKVWETWIKNGVQTIHDALKYKEEIEQKWNNNSKIKEKVVNKPDWLDEYIKEISEMEG